MVPEPSRSPGRTAGVWSVGIGWGTTAGSIAAGLVSALCGDPTLFGAPVVIGALLAYIMAWALAVVQFQLDRAALAKAEERVDYWRDVFLKENTYGGLLGAAEKARDEALAGMGKANQLYHDAHKAYREAREDADRMSVALVRLRAAPQNDDGRITLHLLPGTVVTVQGPGEPFFTFAADPPTTEDGPNGREETDATA